MIDLLQTIRGFIRQKSRGYPSEAEKLFSLSKEYGVPIDAAEFANEPNMMEETGFPKGYTPAHYRRRSGFVL